MTKELKLVRIAIAFALAGAAASGPALSQESAQPLKLTMHALKGGAYWVEGGRSNTGFVVGDKGVVIIDAQMTPEAVRQELAAIARITPKPVNAIVISHADPDHVGGLLFYPAGSTIIEHENTRSEILVSGEDPKAPPAYVQMYKRIGTEFAPTRTIGSTEDVVLDGVRMTLIYPGPAHTSGDLIVYLPLQKVVYAADIITTNTGRFPVIHFGGSSLGWINAMKTILALNVDTYVAGHGAFETKAQLAARLRDVEQRRTQIKAMVEAGKSLAEVEAALPEPGASPMFMTFTQTVYGELTKGYPPASPPWTNLIHR